jgi:TatD DNase family protein
MLLQRSNGGDGLPKGRAGVLHAFSADLEMACRAIDLGFFIGVAGPITFKNAGRLRELVAELPLSTLLVETDSPYLTPDPYRGKRNEPAYVTMVAEHLSQSIGSDYHQTSHVTSENAAELFGWHYGKDDRNIH